MAIRKRNAEPGTTQSSHADAILKDAHKELKDPARRLLGKRILSLGGLALLSGCNLSTGKSVNTMLRKISFFNDDVQALLFDVPDVDAGTYRLQVGGLANGKRLWTLDELHALPKQDQIMRHICIEGWSAIGRWGGVRFADFLKRAGADTTARFVALHCADNYWTSIDMPTALHAQTLLTLTYDGQVLPPKYGFPMKLRMPTKLGYNNPKHIVAITVTSEYPGGYWENQGYNWFGGS